MQNETELLIKKAAMKIFLAKGLAGARLQEIADEAGINRTTLHYYFRNKERLFEVVFKEAMDKMNERLIMTIQSDLPLLDKIRHIVEAYIDSAMEEPNFEMFFMNEYNQNPGYMNQIIRQQHGFEELDRFHREIGEAVSRGEIIGDVRQLMLNLMSLCVFPFAGKAMVPAMMGISEDEYMEILRQRKQSLADFIIRAITP